MTIMDELIKKTKTNPEIAPLIYDILRTLTMQFFVQFMFYINNPNVSLLSPIFIQTTIFLIIGVIVFWLIVYKLFSRSYPISLFNLQPIKPPGPPEPPGPPGPPEPVYGPGRAPILPENYERYIIRG